MAADTLNMPAIAATATLGTPTFTPRPNGSATLTVDSTDAASTAPVTAANKTSTFSVG